MTLALNQTELTFTQFDFGQAQRVMNLDSAVNILLVRICYEHSAWCVHTFVLVERGVSNAQKLPPPERNIQHHLQITAWQGLFKEAWGQGFLCTTKDQPNISDTLPAFGTYSF